MQFINHYGFTQRLHSDQGRNCTLAKGDKTITKPCHPMGNGQTERTLDGTLLGMLSTLSANEKSNWKHIVAPVVHAFFTIVQRTAAMQSPFFLIYCHQPRLPIDLVLGVKEDVHLSGL